MRVCVGLSLGWASLRTSFKCIIVESEGSIFRGIAWIAYFQKEKF